MRTWLLPLRIDVPAEGQRSPSIWLRLLDAWIREGCSAKVGAGVVEDARNRCLRQESLHGLSNQQMQPHSRGIPARPCYMDRRVRRRTLVPFNLHPALSRW